MLSLSNRCKILIYSLVIALIAVITAEYSIDCHEDIPESDIVLVEDILVDNCIEEEIILDNREEIEAIARTLYGECRGVSSTKEKAAVVWVILNRVDAGYGSIVEVIKAPSQFIGYSPYNPLQEDLVLIAEDVMIRWYRENLGESNVGRVLPENYLYFSGDGEHNYFRDKYRGGNRWDWSLHNPYEN